MEGAASMRLADRCEYPRSRFSLTRTGLDWTGLERGYGLPWVTPVFSGVLGVAVFGISFTPVFYSLVMWCAGRPDRSRHRIMAGDADRPRVGQ